MGELKFGGQAAGVEGIDFLVGHGFDFADLNLNEMDKIRSQERQMLKAARKRGLFFTAHGPDLRVDEPRGLARIEEAVAYGEAFHPRTITIHPILAPFANTPEKIEVKLREIARLSRAAMSFGARIACENTAEEAADMKRLLDTLPDVVLTVDIGHSELLSKNHRNKSLDFINTYPERIGHVHIHDNVGGDTYYEDLHLPLGEGRIDFAPILAGLRALPQEITVTFEMPRQKAYESLLWLRERDLA